MMLTSVLTAIGFLMLALQVYVIVLLRKVLRKIPDFSLIYPELSEDFEYMPPTRREVLPQVLNQTTDNSPTAFYKRSRIAAMQQFTPAQCVVTSVYAPETVSRREPFLLVIFAHTKPQTKEADEMARIFDEELIKKAVKDLGISAKPGDKLGFTLQLANWPLAESYQEIHWHGDIQSVEFEMKVPATYQNEIAIGTVTVSHKGVPMGNIKFKLKIGAAGATGNYATAQAKTYKKAFISYASENRAEVLKRSQAISAAGIDVFHDVVRLKPGDAWEQELYQHIDSSDVFFLFWTEAARQSDWVAKEWHYALQIQQTKGMPDIIPIPIEGPPIATPPKALSHLHFNDKYLYFQL